jgi:two-component system NtrC family response regulator
MARILIIDDDKLIRSSLARCFDALGHDVIVAEGLTQGTQLARENVDIIYLDLNLPDGDGRTAINDLSAAPGTPEVIVLTGLSDNFGAKETLTSGAWDYIQKPATPTTLRNSLESALKYRTDKCLAQESGPIFNDSGIIGDSSAIDRAKQLMGKAAQSEASVLILGETGVGKELAAQAIHSNSPRKNSGFVVVDCSNLTESLLESVLYGHVKGAFTGAHSDHRGLIAEADGGTLFLDEIGELPPSLQKSFLRVLQEHRYRPVGSTKEKHSDFRLVSATNRNLEAMTKAGTFRSDLLFRLRTLEIGLPALRDRSSDIMKLATYFTQTACDRYRLPQKKFSKQLASVIKAYTWPGNVREISNVMEAAVIAVGQEPTIYPKHLPGHIRISFLNQSKPKKTTPKTQDMSTHDGPIQSYQNYKAMRDQAYFQQLMDICDFDITKASQLAGISVPSVYRHLGLAGISTKKR